MIKVLFQTSFLMLVLALIISIPITNNSFSQLEENIQGQGQQQQKYKHHNLAHKILMKNMIGLIYMRISLLTNTLT